MLCSNAPSTNDYIFLDMIESSGCCSTLPLSLVTPEDAKDTGDVTASLKLAPPTKLDARPKVPSDRILQLLSILAIPRVSIYRSCFLSWLSESRHNLFSFISTQSLIQRLNPPGICEFEAPSGAEISFETPANLHFSNMPLLFPTQGTLRLAFGSAAPEPVSEKRSSYKARTDLYPAWSAVDDVKSKAGQLTEEAQKEYTKASQAAQAKTGKIVLYSPQYYAACTLGGLLACVSIRNFSAGN